MASVPTNARPHGAAGASACLPEPQKESFPSSSLDSVGRRADCLSSSNLMLVCVRAAWHKPVSLTNQPFKARALARAEARGLTRGEAGGPTAQTRVPQHRQTPHTGKEVDTRDHKKEGAPLPETETSTLDPHGKPPPCSAPGSQSKMGPKGRAGRWD